ncbi:putative ATP-binding cassette transporter [Paraburkholderia eburnea]|uniref:Putative ATP-binding cassette transporter n=1 Tax=Paraburkholderia eburnea TaxID=1189126 RepID=A0A2S4LV45_9BURK|nr:cyclic peptide export ABC transporter [Paraburkholderia eburnea]POR46310.1 putative ATP-binding cassette transporter [Paraburkholderia eburnea]PRZ16263.1 putative ATP-binding cassette transporter [Paraburkholderia eburnea]
MSLIAPLIRSSRWLLPIALLISLSSGLANAALVALINQALRASAEELLALGLRFAWLALFVLATRVGSQTLFMYLGQRAKARLRMQAIRRITAASYGDLEHCGASRAIGALTQDLDSIVIFFISLPSIVMQGAVIAGCLIYLGMLSSPILVFAFIVLGVGSWGTHLVSTRALTHLRASREREDSLLSQFRALFDGAKELKLHRARSDAFVDRDIAPHVEAVRRQRTRGYVLHAVAASWGNLLLFAFVGLTIFVLAHAFHADAHVMSGYALVFLYLIMPVEGLLAALPSIGSARIAFERVARLETALPPEQSAPPAAAHVSFASIAFEHVEHRYMRDHDDGFFTLGPLDLTLDAGELVFLVGGNGSGKTTFAKLLVGLYAPESGRILVDGAPVTASDRAAYRQRFSVVFSDFHLFDSLLGLPAQSEENARALLVALQLDHKVRIENGAFSTLALSQGQRKRLALLVAVLEDRPFYVFDEWAADQDPEFKEVFYRTLLPQLKARGKTVLVITHDDRYFPLADRIIKLDSGRLSAGHRGTEWTMATAA